MLLEKDYGLMVITADDPEYNESEKISRQDASFHFLHCKSIPCNENVTWFPRAMNIIENDTASSYWYEYWRRLIGKCKSTKEHEEVKYVFESSSLIEKPIYKFFHTYWYEYWRDYFQLPR
jgi:hypothetical protein